jgi:hypothetical protein
LKLENAVGSGLAGEFGAPPLARLFGIGIRDLTGLHPQQTYREISLAG